MTERPTTLLVRDVQVEFLPAAQRALRKLPLDVQRRLRTAIVALADDPRPAGCRSVKGRLGHLRIRVGDYRVIYVPRDAQLVVIVVDAGHRREI